MTPPPLSPAAQAVLDAVLNETSPVSLQRQQRMDAAIAIRAVADQVAWPIPDDCSADVFNRQLEIRSEILAIAAELYGGNTTTETP